MDRVQVQDGLFKFTMKRFPIFISVCCIFAIAYSLLVGTPKYGILIVSVATLTSAMLWRYMENDIKKAQVRPEPKETDPTTPNKISSSVNINIVLFALLYSGSLITLHIREDLYTRPLLFFVIISLMICILVNFIFKLPSIKTKYSWIILILSCLVTSTLIYSQIYIYPSVTGIDSWFHQFLTNELINNGHIPDIPSYYTNFIGYHVIIAFTSIFASVTFKSAAALSVILGQTILTTITFYLMGRMIYNESIGLLSGLFGPLSYLFLIYVFHLMPFSFGLILALFSLLLIIRGVKKTNRSYEIGFMIVFLSLIILHPLPSSFWVLVIGISYILSALHPIAVQQTPNNINMPLIVLLCFTLLLGYWIYIGAEMLSIGLNFLDIDAKIHAMDPSELLPRTYIIENAMPQSMLANICVNAHYITSGFSIMGILFLSSQSRHQKLSIALLIVLIMSFCIALLGYCIGIDLENQRWLMLGHLILIVPFSISIYICYNSLLSTGIRSIVFNAFIFLTIFAIITSSSYDADTPAKSMTVRYSLTDAELRSYQTVSEIWDKEIATDSYGRLWFLWTKGYPTSGIINLNNNFFDLKLHSDPNLLYIIDHRLTNEPIPTSQGNYILNYNIENYFSKRLSTKVYNSNSISAYILLEPTGD